MKRYLLPLLVLLPLALALALVSLWFTPQGQLLIPAWTAPGLLAPDIPAPVEEPPPLQAAPLIETINERPLYASLRRPPAPPSTQAPPPPPPPDPIDQTQVQGILQGDLNIVLATVDGRPRRLQLNDRVGDWTLERVAARSAVFARKGEEREIQLNYSPLRGSPARAASPAAGAPAASTPAGAPASADDPAAAAAASAAPTPAAAAPGGLADANRERLRRRNEMRERAGLPPLTQN